MDDELDLELVNRSPDAVRFDTGLDKLRKTIHPSEMSSGVLVINQNITGIRAGTFSIRATLFAFGRMDPKTPLEWIQKMAELKREAANQSENTKNQEA